MYLGLPKTFQECTVTAQVHFLLCVSSQFSALLSILSFWCVQFTACLAWWVLLNISMNSFQMAAFSFVCGTGESSKRGGGGKRMGNAKSVRPSSFAFAYHSVASFLLLLWLVFCCVADFYTLRREVELAAERVKEMQLEKEIADRLGSQNSW